MDEFQQETLRRLDRIERKTNEVVSCVMVVYSLGSAAGAGVLARAAASYFLGRELGDAFGGIAAVIAFFSMWISLHTKIFDVR